MFTFPVIFMFTALLAYGVFGPIKRPYKRFWHNALFVCGPEQGRFGNWPAAVDKQERGEWRIKHFIAIVAALPLTFFVHTPFLDAILYAFGVFIISSLLRAFAFWDYGGCGVEIIEAERLGVVTIKGPGIGRDSSVIPTGPVELKDYYEAEVGDYVSYRQGEIERMIYFDERWDDTPEQVDARLKKWNWLAKFLHRLAW